MKNKDETPDLNKQKVFTERLDEILMRRGFSTNRKVRRLVQTHELRVNGNRIVVPETRVSLRHDVITLDGKSMDLKPDIYLVMNKKSGCLCTNSQEDRLTVFDFVPEEYKSGQDLGVLHTVGRLDGNTEGLLLLTTNGDFSHSLVVPENHIEKKYYIELDSPVSDEEKPLWVEKCREGLHLPEAHSGPCVFTKPAILEWKDDTSCFLTITEGKFHQVKRMIKVLGNGVSYLKRVSMGPFVLPHDLKPGQCRPLTDEELVMLSERPGE